MLEDKTMHISAEQQKLITDARHELHSMPELACCECKTKGFIIDFLRKHTSLEINDMGRWLYAAHREGACSTVAFRADFDAVQTESGCAAHRCGHDGHTAALLGLALLIEGKTLGKNVILLFQHAEENGLGGAECCRLFELERIDLMFGCHNIPGEPLGTVLLKQGTFACASSGMQAEFTGKPTHAAYPENGINPTEAIARFAVELPKAANEIALKGRAMTIATIVGMYSGERAFGVAAAKGAVYATLRSEDGACFEELKDRAVESAKKLAADSGVDLRIGFFDEFPPTVNNGSIVHFVEDRIRPKAIKYKYLNEPFRWSEDFGHYGKHTDACFFGIGSGEETAPLHTERYEYPDELAGITSEVFYSLI